MGAHAFTYAALSDWIPSGFGRFDVACPACGPAERRSAVNRRRKVLRVWRVKPGFLTYKCQRCGAAGWVAADGQQLCSEPKPAAAVAAAASDDAERTAWALRLWREGRSPGRTLVERHFRDRGLPLPLEAGGEAIRYLAKCPFGHGVTVPAMVALVRDIRSDAPIAIHRTALDPITGQKAEIDGPSRMSLGPIAGGVVKLSPDYAVETVLGIGEGIESTLSLRQIPGCETLPVWAALSKGGMRSFPVLPGIQVLWLAVDNDPDGIAAAAEVRARWRRAGREVVSVKAKTAGEDLNDVARRRRNDQPPGATERRDDGPEAGSKPIARHG